MARAPFTRELPAPDLSTPSRREAMTAVGRVVITVRR
jgi:hypothetical protein